MLSLDWPRPNLDRPPPPRAHTLHTRAHAPHAQASPHLPTHPPTPGRLDIDWEYPGASDRGGQWTDRAGLVEFVKEYKYLTNQAGKGNLQLMFAVGAGPYGYQGTLLSMSQPAATTRDAWGPRRCVCGGGWVGVGGDSTARNLFQPWR